MKSSYRPLKNRIQPWQLFLMLFVLSPWASFAQTATSANSFTLEQSIDFALKNSVSLKNAQLSEYIADHQAKELISLGYPQINAALDFSHYPKLPVSILPGVFSPEQEQVSVLTTNGSRDLAFPKIDPETGQPIPGPDLEVQFGTPFQATAGISGRQLVFDGTFFLGLRAAEVFVELSSRQIDATAEDIALTVSKAYYTALIAQESLKLIDANMARVKKLHDDTKALYDEGFAEKLDVERLEITYTNLQLERTKAERMAALSKDLLKFQMGMPVAEDLSLAEKVGDLNAAPEVAIAPQDFSYSNRIEYKLLETQQELEGFNMRRFKAGYLPTLYLFGSYQFNAQRNKFNFFNTNENWFQIGVWGFNLNIPIFDGGMKKHQIQQSNLRLQQLANSKSLLENSINLELRNTQAQLMNSYNNLEVYRKNVDLARKVYEVSEEKYKEGVGSSLEINDADTQLKQSETNYLNAMFEYLNNKADYQKARGEFSKYH